MTSDVRPVLVPEPLTSGDAEPVIVTDFLRFSGAPRLSHVLAGQAHGHPVFAVDPVADLARWETFVPLDELAAGYADAFSAAAPAAEGAVVIGYCAAGALALRIAARLTRSGRVLTILARPTWPDTAMIRASMASFRADLGTADGSPDDLANDLTNDLDDDLANDLTNDLDGDPAMILRRLERVLQADMRAMARTRGLDKSASAVEALDDLLGRYRVWLGFLLASRAALKPLWHPGVPVDVLTETSGPARVPWLEPGSYAVTRLSLPEDESLATTLLARSALTVMRDWQRPGDQPPSLPGGC
ncbi:MAG TPA: hypothetical protein VGS62_02610 [Streptosporangiaceae bacterium]|nr:hypothetical protein [Streptosporangiaceae bacterium]